MTKIDNLALAERAWSWLDMQLDWTTGSTRDLQQQYFDLLAEDVVLEVDAPSNTFAYESAFRGGRIVKLRQIGDMSEWIEAYRS